MRKNITIFCQAKYKVMDSIVGSISRRLDPDKPIIIGISGCSGSGKSHFASMLKESLLASKIKAHILSYDDFINLNTDEKGLRLADDDWLLRVIGDFLECESHTYKPIWLDPHTKGTETINIQGTKVILLEGTTVLADNNPLQKYIAFGIFLDTSDDNIWKWKWEREQAAYMGRTWEQFARDTDLDMKVYHKEVACTKSKAKFIVRKDDLHNMEIIKQ
jgi:uridine kinase